MSEKTEMDNVLGRPSLSVIVTVYNVAEYLEDCLNSILAQTVLPEKIILVDDGSTDGSGDICDKYSDKNDFTVVLHQNNKGVSFARLAGYKAADTEYVLFVDADDFISETLVEKVQPYIEKGIDIITFGINRYYSSNYFVKDEVNIEEGIHDRDYLENEVFPKMLWDADIHTSGVDSALWNKVVKRTLYDGEFESISKLNIHYGEDVGVIYSVFLKANSLAIIKECEYYHRQKKERKLPLYLVDEEYISKVHKLYEYLKMKLPNNDSYSKQIEYYYLHALEERLHKYADYRTRRLYVFPFDKVEKGKKLLLHGAGEVGQNYYRQLLAIDYCKEIVWIDQNYKKYNGYRVESPEQIVDISYFDYIVIAILSENAAEDIKKSYVSKDFPEDKIIWCIKC